MKKHAKRLTVTYGAFSVTLEGYDDAVEAAKALADHFLKLDSALPGFGTGQVDTATAEMARAPAKDDRSGERSVRDDAEVPDAADPMGRPTVPATADDTWSGRPLEHRAGFEEEDGTVGELEAILRRLEARKAALAQARTLQDRLERSRSEDTAPGDEPRADDAGHAAPSDDAFPGPDMANASPPEDDPASSAGLGRSLSRELPGDVGRDVTRLMAETDQQMQEPEGRTRRDAFAHLRAAAVARFADQTLAGALRASDETVRQYRGDLAEAVGGGAALPRRRAAVARNGASPLKLCADQRVDPAE